MSLEMETLGAVKSFVIKKVAEFVSGMYRPAGSKTVSELTQSLLIKDNVGNVYNAADSGTTTSDFVEGAGNPINAGDNILVADVGTASNPVYKFDILAGAVDLSDCILKSDTVGLVKNDGTIDTTQYADKTEMSITDGTGADAGTSTIQLKTGTSKKVLTAHQDISGKAEKSEMSVTDGTGADADKTTIQLKQGTSATVLKSHQDISGKANRVSGAVTGNFASLDANGNPADSGKKASDFVEAVQGKGLSTNDYTDAEKTKLAGLSNYDDTALSDRVTAVETVVPSEATAQNKLSTAADIAGKNISATSTTSPITDSADGMMQGLTIYGKSEVVNGEIVSAGKGWASVRLADLQFGGNAGLFYATITDAIEPVINGTTVLCEKYETYIGNPNLQPDKTINAFNSSGSALKNVVIKDSNYTTVSDFVASLSDATLCYQLADPTQGNTIAVKTDNGTGIDGTMATFTTALPLCSIPDTTIHDELNAGKEVVKQCGEVDLGDFEWTYDETYNRFIASASNINIKKNQARTLQMICERYLVIDDSRDIQDVPDNSIYTDMYPKIYVHDSLYSDAATFKAAVTGVKLVYPLETPTTIPLTDTEISAFRQLRTFDSTTNINITDELEFEIDYLRNTENGEAVSRVVDDLQGQINTKYQLSEGEIIAQIADRIYQGTDLTVKFALEIATYNNDPWSWIKTRITAGNFSGIHVGDYIPFTTTNNITLNAQIAGINTYKGYGDSPVGSHVDFICKELWPTLHSVNKVKYNNGTSTQNSSWLASDLYLYLNSLAGTVPNEEAVVGGGEGTAVDYTADGVYYYLPTQLKNVIQEKRFKLPTRYSASERLFDDNGWASWTNIGKLWLPDECEVYGMPVWSGKGGYSIGGSIQYPLFAGNMNRLKYRDDSSYYWWLLSPYSGDSERWCLVGNSGLCTNAYASGSSIAAPVCFRIA